jgi:hypothetical protein
MIGIGGVMGRHIRATFFDVAVNAVAGLGGSSGRIHQCREEQCRGNYGYANTTH